MTQQIALVFQLLLSRFYCSCKDIVSLDIAVSSCPVLRTGWLEQVRKFMTMVANRWYHSHSTIRWMNKREIPIFRLLVDCRTVDLVSNLDWVEKRNIARIENDSVEFLSKRNPSVSVGVLLTKLANFDPSILLGAYTDLPLYAKRYQSHLLSLLKADDVSDLSFVDWKLSMLREVNLSCCQRITDIGLSDLFRGCPHLQKINLSHCMGFTERSLSELGRKCPHIESINFSHCQMSVVMTVSLFSLIRQCILLHTIILSNLETITDNLLLIIGSASSQLHTIDVSDCHGITDVGLSALASQCKLLQTINVRNCLGITDTSLVAFGLNSSQLHTIYVSDCQGITDVGLSALAYHCKLLQTINLRNCQGITDTSLVALGLNSSQLHTIDVSDCHGITDVGLSALANHCKLLQTINVRNCQGINEDCFSALALISLAFCN
jgi:Leucine Rich repeat